MLKIFTRNGSVEMKIKVHGSMFPEKIEFDGENYRTTEYNKVLDLIFQETNKLRGKGKRKRRKTTVLLLPCTQSRGRTGTGYPTGV